MRNGFKITLMMVAIALIGMRAMAMAPTINQIPSPIIGDMDDVTDTNEFVYPDALLLDNYATDTDGPNQDLVWSFDADDDKYLFNGVGPLPPSGDPVAPGANAIDNQVVGGEQNPDGNAATVTVRNQDLSPIGGANTDPGTAGILPGETRAITLYASDGATVSSTTIMVYTDNNGADRLSPGGGEEVYLKDFATDGNAGLWQFAGQQYAGLGAVTSSFNGGICMEVEADGPNEGLNASEWYQPYSDGVELVANSAYEARAHYVTNQTTVGNVPFISLIFDNSHNSDPFGAANVYSGETFILDNVGGANAPEGLPGEAGLAEHKIMFAPPAVMTTKWNANIFTAGNDPVNDFRLRWTMQDLSGLGYGAESDSGRVCMTYIQVLRHDLAEMTVVSTPYDVTNLQDASDGSGTHTVFGVANNLFTDVTWAGGNVTIAPDSGGSGWENEVVEVRPGDTNSPVQAGGAALVDNYPIEWTDDVTYQVTVEMSAPAASDEENPPDIIRMGMDTPTQELIGLCQVSNNLNNIGMPATGTPQAYVAFFNSNKATLSTVSEHDRLRPRLDLISNNGLQGQGKLLNTGAVTVHSMQVDVVSFD